MLKDDGEVSEVVPDNVDGWIDGMHDADSVDDDVEELFGRSDDDAEDDDDLFAHPVPDEKTTDPLHIKTKGDEREPEDLRSPVRPSARAVELHQYTHLPFRSWCPVCIAARAKEDSHRRSKPRDDDYEHDGSGLPIVSLDYQELDETSDSPTRVIVGKDESTGNVLCHKVLMKGIGDEWAVKKLVQDIEDWGRSKVILKTDGEPAIKALQSRVISLRPPQTVPRNPPAYNPQSNGPCEKAVQDVTAQLRTLKLALENRVGIKVDEELPIVEWLLEHSCFLLNKFSVGKDGMTPHERLTGRRWKKPILEFGEFVMAKLSLQRRNAGKTRKQKRKLAPRAIPAVWVGQVPRTGEHIVIKQDGDAVRCRTVKRVPKEDRWHPTNIMLVKATPRCPAPSSKNPEKLQARAADDEHGRAIKRDKTEHHGAEAAEKLDEVDTRDDDHSKRNFRITEDLLNKYGRTPGCAGCYHIPVSLGDHRPHAPECRGRIRDAMSKDNRHKFTVQRADERLNTTAPLETADDSLDVDMIDRDAQDLDIPELTFEEDEEMPTVEVDPVDQAAWDTFVDNTFVDEKPSDNLNATTTEAADEPDDATPEAKRQRMSIFLENLPELETSVARTIAYGALDNKHYGVRGAIGAPSEEPRGETPKGDSKIDQVENEIKGMLAQLGTIKNASDVRKIIDKLGQSKGLKHKVKQMQRPSMRNTGSNDISEAYSPARCTAMATKVRGLRPGFAIDLTTADENGVPWDFSDDKMQKKAMDKIDAEEPFMLITCPMCAKFCALQALFNYPRMPASKVWAELEAAMKHLKFALEMCLKQHRAGRLFIFEHPAEATSWSYEMIVEFGKLDGVHRIQFDFCRLGMMTKDKDGNEKFAKKRTAILTNSDAVATLLRHAQCLGDHSHEQLLGGKASACQQYPDKFTMAICEGVKREMDTIKWRDEVYDILDVSTPFGKLMKLQEIIEAKAVAPEEDHFSDIYDGMSFMDDVHGGELDRAMAIKARRVEIDYFKRMGVYTKVKRRGGMKIISTKWIDTNKGDLTDPNYRARLVGREIATTKRDDLFAATPPLESLRYIVSTCASNQLHAEPAERYCLMSNDVKRAYFYAPSTRPIFIQIPEEDREEGDEDMVGQLNLSLYGTRDAALNWTNTFTEHLVSIGFDRGSACPCNFFHEERGIALTVHGDDFTSTGREKELKWFETQLQAKYDIKTSVMGPRASHEKQLRILNRVITWTESGMEFEPDQRHAEIIVKSMDVSKGVATPGTRDEATAAGVPDVPKPVESVEALEKDITASELVESPLLEGAEATTFRSMAARANFLALDRPDIQFSVKEVARRMARPRWSDWALLKRLARYLVVAPRCVTHFAWQHPQTSVDVYVDADWAGCKRTSRSTSGGAVMVGWHTIKTWSSTQATVALSSGESELYSLTKGASQALGFIALARDLGAYIHAVVHTDASATLGIVNRQGLGKLRHVNVQYLWLQEKVRDKSLSVVKVPGPENPADLMTKYLPAAEIEKHLEALAVERRDNRAENAPKLGVNVLQASDVWASTDESIDRVHTRPRSQLFTPMRVDGSPPAKALTSTRITSGVYLDSGESFKITDEWRGRGDCHRDLGRIWRGSTRFFLRS